MAQSAIEQTQAHPSQAPDREGAPFRVEQLIRGHPALATGVALLLASALLVLWAGTRPGFDPYGWLVWGHQTIIGALNTNAAPSWKPLPYLFTVPFALAGHYQVWLWMVASVAVSLSGVIFAARIAYRLTAAPPERHYAALSAAAFAGLALLGLRDYPHYLLSAQSDPMIVALCLGAIDCHLSGRFRWAFVLGCLAGLGRPEVWLFLGLYLLWAQRAVPRMRWLLLASIALMLALWFGIPALTSRSAFVAGTNALHSGRALHTDKVFGTIDRFLDLHETPLELLAVLLLGLALWRRERVLLALAGGALAWVVLEIAFALHGWPGLPRYLFEPAALMVVFAAVTVGRLLAQAPAIPRAPAWIGIPLVVLALASLVPAALSRARIEHKDLVVQRQRTDQINRLAGTISRLGGAGRIRPCGEPLTRLEYQTILAWELRVNVATVGFKYGPAIRSGRPVVLFTPRRRGWRVQGRHQRLAACQRLGAG